MVVRSGWGYMICGFLGENLSIFSIFCQEGFLWFRRLSLHGQVSRHGQFVEGGRSKRGDETRAASLDTVDDERIDCSIREVLGEFGREIPA